MSFKRVILDIEANNFLENMLDFTQKPLKLKSTARIWCIVIRCIDTKESKMLIPPYILDNIDAYKRTADPEQVMKYSKLDVIPLTRESLKECLKDVEEFVAHSGIKYDLPALKYFDLLDYYIGYPDLNGINKFNNKTTINGKETVITDTLLWSKLVNPDRYQHGLEYFGKLFGNQKIEFKAFHEFSIEMVNYCITPDMRLLDDNLTWRPASSFKVGETILGFDEENQSNRSGRRYKNSIIEIITPDKQEVFEVKLQSGKILKVTKEHRFLTCVDSSNGYTNYNWTMTKDLVFGQSNTGNSKLPCLLPVEEKLNSYDSGWLAGIFDGDTFGRLELKSNGFKDEVVSVTSIGFQDILKIQTSTGTFMCEGYPMHNCVQDTKVTSLIYKTLADEYNSYEGWWKDEKLENKLADLAVKRETYGFWFNRGLAIKCVEDLAIKMTDLENKVNPILPPKPMNKTTLKKFTPPAIQFKKDRSFSANFLKFVEKHNGVLSEDYVEFYGKTYSLPVEQPIKLFEDADISDLDHVKMHLMSFRMP